MLKILKKYKYVITIIFIITTIITIIIAKNNLVMASEESSYLVTDDLISKEKEDSKENNNDEKINEDNQTMYVEIKGAVQNPGVYPIEKNNRVIDIIEKSGGLTENADLSVTNQARLLKDQDIIIIYTKEEVEKCRQITVDSEQDQESNCSIYKPDINIDTCPTPFSEDENSNGQVSNTNELNSKVNINTATVEELMTLDGIGQTKAEAIINYRIEHGSFTNIEDLMNISGIGESTYEKIKDYITT